MESIEGSTANVEIPNVLRTEFSLIDINEDFLSLMDTDGNTRQDIRCVSSSIGFLVVK